MPSSFATGITRGFPEVADGYDPELVDAHLELVANWFAGEKLTELARQAEASAERIMADARAEAASIVAAARRQAARELASGREQLTQELQALEAEVAETAKVRLAEADAELEAYESRRRREADRLVAEPRKRRFGMRQKG
jgi:regulator of protease activity HflC (stomatin/prohibitin superfamily)